MLVERAAGGWRSSRCWPAGSRPFIDGSPDNNIFNLIIGYNGLGADLLGRRAAAVAAAAARNFSGPTGVLRLFNTLMGGQASWLLPAALLALVVGLWATPARAAHRSHAARRCCSGAAGCSSPRSCSASAGRDPHLLHGRARAGDRRARRDRRRAAVAARDHAPARAASRRWSIAAAARWAYALLDAHPVLGAWLRVVIAASAALARRSACSWRRSSGGCDAGLALAVAALGAVAMLAGPLAYAAETSARAHRLDPLGRPGARRALGGGPGRRRAAVRRRGGPAAAPAPAGRRPTGGGGGRRRQPAAGRRAGSPAVAARQPGRAPRSSRRCERDASRYRWVAATSGSQSAASSSSPPAASR